MNKEQFKEVLSGFVAERLVDALAEQAEKKGYFISIPDTVLYDDGEKFIEVRPRRRNCKITRLDSEMRKTVDNMLANGCTYSHISEVLRSAGINISRQAICNYRNNFFNVPTIEDKLIADYRTRTSQFSTSDLSSSRGHRTPKTRKD